MPSTTSPTTMWHCVLVNDKLCPMYNYRKPATTATKKYCPFHRIIINVNRIVHVSDSVMTWFASTRWSGTFHFERFQCPLLCFQDAKHISAGGSTSNHLLLRLQCTFSAHRSRSVPFNVFNEMCALGWRENVPKVKVIPSFWRQSF